MSLPLPLPLPPPAVGAGEQTPNLVSSVLSWRSPLVLQVDTFAKL
jgi:hypothetical protein